MFPIRLGTGAEFTALRDALLACDYTEAAICSRFKISCVPEFPTEGPAVTSEEPADTLGLLVRLFLEGGAISSSAASRLPMAALEPLGLVRPLGERILGTVMLYPTRGLHIASDRSRPVGNEELLSDVVYPAIVPNTALFLDYVPPGKCDAFLDLCAGTGIAALVAAQKDAAHAWAFDITARATHFAEFNRRLNDIPNVTACEGDLYAPAGGQTFDRIVAHPPYLPVYRPHYLFDSGGQDGEQVVRRMVEDLPGYLRPGGKFYALTMGSDRERPFEHRLRQWLGAAAPDFDIALLVRKTMSASAYAADVVVLQKGSADDIAGWRELFEQWDVRALVYGVVVIQRRTGDRPVFTVRRDVGPKTGPAECAWLVDWATAALDASKVLPMKPRARDNVSLKVEHRFSGGEWQPESYRLVSEYPFRATMKCESWAPHLLTIANGSHTIQELLAQLKSSEALPQTVAPIEFAPVVAAMICSGFLEVDEFKLPVANTADAR
jgi:SAM-dependent methyltransferase